MRAADPVSSFRDSLQDDRYSEVSTIYARLNGLKVFGVSRVRFRLNGLPCDCGQPEDASFEGNELICKPTPQRKAKLSDRAHPQRD